MHGVERVERATSRFIDFVSNALKKEDERQSRKRERVEDTVANEGMDAEVSSNPSGSRHRVTLEQGEKRRLGEDGQ